MNSYIELLNNVAASSGGFADANLGPDRARKWLVERFPGTFEISGGDDDKGDKDFDLDFGDEESSTTLRLRSGAKMPSAAALRAALGLDDDETVPSGDPERTLVPLARRLLAKQRQEMLATMVMLGMQRIVIDSGRIQASMRFHIDTRSAARSDEGSTFDFLAPQRCLRQLRYRRMGCQRQHDQHHRLRLHRAAPDNRGDERRSRHQLLG